jgi:hypothetical protein
MSAPVPPLAPDELVSTRGEREVLEAFLDLYRDILKRKLAGLSDEQIRERHVPSATTLGGLVKHLTAVEREWFQVVLAEDGAPAFAGDGWTLRGGDSAASLIEGMSARARLRGRSPRGSRWTIRFRMRGWGWFRCGGFTST